MAVDFDAVKRKLAQISGKNSRASSMWKPEMDVEYIVRFIPFANNEGQPFKERYFYYGIGNNPGLLAPSQFGKRDPFEELSNQLAQDGNETWELRKKIRPAMRAYGAVIVRKEEDKGPRLWAFGKAVYKQILSVIADEEYGDVTDIQNGYDFKVLISKAPGAQFATTEVSPRRKSSPLSTDPAQISKWMNSIPDLDAMFELKSYEELERIVNAWLNSNDGTVSDDDGAERGGAKAKPTPAVKPAAASKSSVHDDIDAAFADVISDD